MKCKYKKFETILKHYGFDWTNLEIRDAILMGKDLMDIKLPLDIDLFQKIKDKSLMGCKLPSMDYSNYNFDEVIMVGCIFGIGSTLPSDTDLFQKIKFKSICNCQFPSMDYSSYNFNGVDVSDCNVIEFVCENVHNYDLNQFALLDFSHEKFNGRMSQMQSELVKLKYPERISAMSIILPKVLRKEEFGSTSVNDILI